MAWQRHASVDDHRVIASGPAHLKFEDVATDVLIQTIKFALRERTPINQRAGFDAQWMRLQIMRRRPGARDAYVFVEDHIRDVVRGADDALGGYGASATQWMNDRLNELWRDAERHWGR